MAGIETIPMLGRLTQFSGAEIAQNALNAPLEAQARDLQGQQFSDAMLARAVQMGAESPEAWDAAMKRAAEQGVPEAGGLVGKWNPLTVDRLMTSLQGRTQAPAGVGIEPRGRAPSIAGAAAAPAGDNTDVYAAPPEQLKRSLEAIDMGLQLLQKPGLTLQDYQAGIEQIKGTGHPEAEKFRNVLSELNFGPESVRALYDRLKAGREQIAQRLGPETVGLPAAQPRPTYGVHYDSGTNPQPPIIERRDPRTGELTLSYANISGAAGPGGRPQLTNQQIDNEAKIRGELTGLSKDFIAVRDAYGRIQASVAEPSAAGDLAAIFNYMKLLDPGSTVREGEFATAQNAQGVPGQIVSMYNKVVSGERLNDNQRDDFLKQAGNLYRQQKRNYDKTRDQYTKIAKEYGFDPARTVPDLGFDQSQPPGDAAPDAGVGNTTPKVAAPPNNQGATTALPVPKDATMIRRGQTYAPRDKAEYDLLPSGTRYLHPDGKTKVKP